MNSNTFLYISWDPKHGDVKVFQAYMAVVKAMIHEEMSVALDNVGSGGIVFSSPLTFEDVKARLRHSKYPYLLIDLSLNVETNTLDGYLDKTEIDRLKIFLVEAREKQIISLQSRLEKALDVEDYRSAILYRDQIKDLKKDDNVG